MGSEGGGIGGRLPGAREAGGRGLGNLALKWAWGRSLEDAGGRGAGTSQYHPFKMLSKNPSRQSLVREQLKDMI